MMYLTTVAVKNAMETPMQNKIVCSDNNHDSRSNPRLGCDWLIRESKKYPVVASNVHDENVTNFWNPIGCNRISLLSFKLTTCIFAGPHLNMKIIAYAQNAKHIIRNKNTSHDLLSKVFEFSDIFVPTPEKIR